MANDDATTPAVLIDWIEEMLKSPAYDEQKLRRALSLAAQAARTPAGDRRAEVLRAGADPPSTKATMTPQAAALILARREAAEAVKHELAPPRPGAPAPPTHGDPC